MAKKIYISEEEHKEELAEIERLGNELGDLRALIGNTSGRLFRDVDAANAWMNACVIEGAIVPSLSAAVIAEIEAQATHIGILNNTISTREEMIRDLQSDATILQVEINERDDKIDRMREVVETLGLKAKVLRMLKEEF